MSASGTFLVRQLLEATSSAIGLWKYVTLRAGFLNQGSTGIWGRYILVVRIVLCTIRYVALFLAFSH